MDITIDDYTREAVGYQSKANMASRFIYVLERLNVYIFKYNSYVAFKILMTNWE